MLLPKVSQINSNLNTIQIACITMRKGYFLESRSFLSVTATGLELAHVSLTLDMLPHIMQYFWVVLIFTRKYSYSIQRLKNHYFHSVQNSNRINKTQVMIQTQ